MAATGRLRPTRGRGFVVHPHASEKEREWAPDCHRSRPCTPPAIPWTGNVSLMARPSRVPPRSSSPAEESGGSCVSKVRLTGKDVAAGTSMPCGVSVPCCPRFTAPSGTRLARRVTAPWIRSFHAGTGSLRVARTTALGPSIAGAQGRGSDGWRPQALDAGRAWETRWPPRKPVLPGGRRAGETGQWLPVSSPLSFPWIRALGLLRPMISAVLPRWAYLVSIASRAATEEASQMCAALRSMTTLSGSVA